LTTARAGVGVNPVITASMPLTDRVPVAYKFLNVQPSVFNLSISGVSGNPPNEETNCAPKLSSKIITKFLGFPW
jgi:hypothetical protein